MRKTLQKQEKILRTKQGKNYKTNERVLQSK
jgi:hypothetical protein